MSRVRAAEVLDSGILEKIKMCKAWNCRRHSPPPSVPDRSPPKHVNYHLWLSPAPQRPFNRNRFHDHWIWDRDYGNRGDGIHDLDIARWALRVQSHPERITTHGCQIHLSAESKFPDNMTVAYHYTQGKVLLYEERTWTPYGLHGLNNGCVFYGPAGWMLFSRRGYFQVYLCDQGEKGPAVHGSRGQQQHLDNFLDCMRTCQPTTAPPQEAHLSCSLAHLGDIAYRVGEVLDFDATGEAFRNIEEANQLLKKSYRLPWAISSNA